MDWLRRLVTIDHPDADVRRRGRLLAIVLVAIIVVLIIFLPLNFLTAPGSFSAYSVPVIMALEIGLLVLARRGQVNLSAWLFILLTIASVLATVVYSPAKSPLGALDFLILGVITAGIVLPPRHIWGAMAISVACCAIGLVARADLASDPSTAVSVFSIALIIVTGAVISYLGARATQRALALAEERTGEATEARRDAEGRAQDLAVQADALRRAEQQLQDLVSTLETPTVPLVEGVLLAPLIGALDSRRAARLTERLLHDVSARRVRLLVLDIAGVATVDTAVAKALAGVVQAVRLLGCKVVLTGVTPGVAVTLTGLGIDLAGLPTARSPQEVLRSLTLGSAEPDGHAGNGGAR